MSCLKQAGGGDGGSGAIETCTVTVHVEVAEGENTRYFPIANIIGVTYINQLGEMVTEGNPAAGFTDNVTFSTITAQCKTQLVFSAGSFLYISSAAYSEEITRVEMFETQGSTSGITSLVAILPDNPGDYDIYIYYK